jgi:hypothetical protein
MIKVADCKTTELRQELKRLSKACQRWVDDSEDVIEVNPTEIDVLVKMVTAVIGMLEQPLAWEVAG